MKLVGAGGGQKKRGSKTKFIFLKLSNSVRKSLKIFWAQTFFNPKLPRPKLFLTERTMWLACLPSFCELVYNVASNFLIHKMHNCIGCICLAFLHCVFLNVSSNRPPLWMCIHTGYTWLAFLHFWFSYMCSQIACLMGCKVTVSAFVRLFSTKNVSSKH